MATTGILRPDEVVFYHPLDSNFQEHTVGETWSGTASSVPGKVGDAESAVTSSDIATGALSTVALGSVNFEHDPVFVAALSTTSVAACWGGPVGEARAGVVSGTTITWGPTVTFRATSDGSPPSQTSQNMRALNSTQVIIGYGKASPLGGYAIVGTVSSTDITFGAEQQWSSNNMNGEMKTEVMDPTHAVVAYREGSSTGHAKSKVLVISGTVITAGPQGTLNATNSFQNMKTIALTSLSSTKILGATAVAGTGELRVGTRVADEVTWGTAKGFSSGNNRVALASLTSTTAVLAIYNAVGNVTAQVLTISGDDVTLGSTVSLVGPVRGADVTKLTSTTCVIAYRGGSDARAVIGTVSGADITLGTFASWNTVTTLSDQSARMSDTTFILGGQEFAGAELGSFRARVGTLDTTAGLTGTGASYPSAIGATRVAMAMWARNLTGGSSTVTVERGYSVAMTATTIALGGTTATWSGAGIGTLMSTMNDDSDHLLVLDFENTSGTDWTLRTSVDGAAFTSQGSQTSGTQAVTTADTDPSADITDGFGSTQWIDELVMWAGDKSSFESFETQEMANLFDLADTFGETMDQFEENFGAPLCWQATATMPDGSVWRDSGSGPCPPVVRVPRGAEDIVVTDDGHKASPRIQEG